MQLAVDLPMPQETAVGFSPLLTCSQGAAFPASLTYPKMSEYLALFQSPADLQSGCGGGEVQICKNSFHKTGFSPLLTCSQGAADTLSGYGDV